MRRLFMTSFFQRLRERREAKNFEIELARVRKQAFEEGQKHAEILQLARWTRPALARAEQAGASADEIAELALAAAAAAKELHQSNATNLDDVAAGVEVSVRAAGEN